MHMSVYIKNDNKNVLFLEIVVLYIVNLENWTIWICFQNIYFDLYELFYDYDQNECCLYFCTKIILRLLYWQYILSPNLSLNTFCFSIRSWVHIGKWHMSIFLAVWDNIYISDRIWIYSWTQICLNMNIQYIRSLKMNIQISIKKYFEINIWMILNNTNLVWFPDFLHQ